MTIKMIQEMKKAMMKTIQIMIVLMMMVVLMMKIGQDYRKEVDLIAVMRMTTVATFMMGCFLYRKGQEKTAVATKMMVHRTNQNQHQWMWHPLHHHVDKRKDNVVLKEEKEVVEGVGILLDVDMILLQ